LIVYRSIESAERFIETGDLHIENN
jgi:hypothetical protein